MKILFIVPYPVGEAPSQRFRFEQYLSLLSEKGYSYTLESFVKLSEWRILYSRDHKFLRVISFLRGLAKRSALMFRVSQYDFVFIHREAAPAGPPVFEWFIAKILRKKIIYDFDDAIWLTDNMNESAMERLVRWRRKVKAICKWSYKISCGNDYLASYAKQFSKSVVYNPTTLDTDNLHYPASKSSSTETITIGWTGSHSTLKYLNEVMWPLRALGEKYPNVDFMVIANQKPQLNLTSLKFLPWKKETETEDLSRFDIGIMPLPDDEWAKGKCGFKALQYMAMGIPAVVSPVGVNVKIVDNAVTGYFASSDEQWKDRLEELIKNESLRKKMGEAGRIKVMTQYSVKSNSATFLSLFE